MSTQILDFDRATLPWLDRYLGEIDAYVASLGDDAPTGYDLREKLLHWAQFGYVIFDQAIPHEMIDAYLADVDELYETRAQRGSMLNVEGFGEMPISELPEEALKSNHLRIMDFHNQSVAGKKLALHEHLTSFLRHIFGDTPVAMQTLTFIHGTEQPWHQDHAFVVAGIPSHLAASWIALEDVREDAGPLGLVPGSHSIRKFDFGNGMFMTPDSHHDEHNFLEHIQEQNQGRGVEEKLFLGKKGDVLLWHAALAHRGTPAKDPSQTRKSLVTHYSSRTAYPVDRRKGDEPPTAYEYNGGLVYRDPVRPELEDSFSRGEVL